MSTSIGTSLLVFPPVCTDEHALGPLLDALRRELPGLRVVCAPFPRRPGWPDPDDPQFAPLVDTVVAQTTGPVHVLGLAAGCYLVTEALLRHPDRVASAVYVGGGFRQVLPEDARARDREQGARALREGMAAIVPPVFERWFSDPENDASGVVEAMRSRLLDVDPHDWNALWHAIAHRRTVSDETAAGITTPISLVAPAHDATDSATLLRAMHTALPQSDYRTIDGPHMVALERPGLVADEVVRHVRNLAALDIGDAQDGHGRIE